MDTNTRDNNKFIDLNETFNQEHLLGQAFFLFIFLLRLNFLIF